MQATMPNVDAAIYLIVLKAEAAAKDLISRLPDNEVLVSGIPHGWVHEPRALNIDLLTGKHWNLFLVTKTSALPSVVQELCEHWLVVDVSVPREQFESIAARRSARPAASSQTPKLPKPYCDGEIPESDNLEALDRPLGPGELRLSRSMADFLSSTLSARVRNAPVSLFNLFKYRDNDSSIHDHYMEGFKQGFGDSAGASVRFMGPVRSALAQGEGSGEGQRWDDVNLVQYDTIWHYAYMLSTDVYKELNEEKVRGLEDTCILLVSEVEVWDEVHA